MCLEVLLIIVLIYLLWSNKNKFDDIRLHSKKLKPKLKYVHGNSDDEIIEQRMIFKYLHPNSTVLELGGNIGRTTLIANSIIDNSKKYVVIEPNKVIANQLIDNRNINNMKFIVVNKAISDDPMILSNWNSKKYDLTEKIPPGWKQIDTITYEDILRDYGIDYFDTLIVDCEGCLYDIIKNREYILDKIHTLILENDDKNKEHQNYLKSLFKRYGFKTKYCYSDNVHNHKWWNKNEDCFWEVLQK